MYNIRRLTESDFDRVFEIFSSNTKFQGLSKYETFNHNINQIWFNAHSKRIKDDNFIYIGNFLNDYLVAFIQGEVWKRGDDIAACIGWTMRDKKYTFNKSHNQTYWSDEILEMENYLIDMFLTRNVTKIYYTTPINSISTQSIHGSRMKMFRRNVLETVIAGTQSSDLDLRLHVYGNMILKVDQELIEYSK